MADTPSRSEPDPTVAAQATRRPGTDTRPPAAVRHLVVDVSAEGQRLDNFLVRTCKGVPKSRLYRIIRSGEVRVNGGRAAPETRLAPGDTVRLPPLRMGDSEASAARAASAPPMQPVVVFEDAALLVIDKPAGLAVHGGSGLSHGVIEGLRAARPQSPFLELAHRIDRDTSGLLVLAKRRSALTALHAAWRDGHVDKRYVAIVEGRWPLRSRTLDAPLLRTLNSAGERRVHVDATRGQPAVTRVTGVRVAGSAPLPLPDGPACGPLTLVDVRIETGRTHQIRVHLQQAGTPIVGDDKYGDFAFNRAMSRAGWRRLFLHARALALAHPLTGEPLRFEAAVPAAFDQMLDWREAAR